MLMLNVFHDDVTMESNGTSAEIMSELTVGVSHVIETISKKEHRSYNELFDLFVIISNMSKKGR